MQAMFAVLKLKRTLFAQVGLRLLINPLENFDKAQIEGAKKVGGVSTALECDAGIFGRSALK